MNIIDTIESENLKKDIPAFAVGDTVKVDIKIVEGDKERIQSYEGIVIARKGSGTRETFAVRRISFGVGVEKIFPIHSPRIDSITLIKKGKVRRAKLNYLRDLSGKSSRIKEDLSLLEGSASNETDDVVAPVETVNTDTTVTK